MYGKSYTCPKSGYNLWHIPTVKNWQKEILKTNDMWQIQGKISWNFLTVKPNLQGLTSFQLIDAPTCEFLWVGCLASPKGKRFCINARSFGQIFTLNLEPLCSSQLA